MPFCWTQDEAILFLLMPKLHKGQEKIASRNSTCKGNATLVHIDLTLTLIWNGKLTFFSFLFFYNIFYLFIYLFCAKKEFTLNF